MQETPVSLQDTSFSDSVNVKNFHSTDLPCKTFHTAYTLRVGLSSLACQEVQNLGKSQPEDIVPSFSETICYTQKVKISGNVIKIQEYELPQIKGVKKGSGRERNKRPLEDQQADVVKNGNRAKDKIMDIVNSNWGMSRRGNFPGGKTVKFLTLTYAENMQDERAAHTDFLLFIDRLEYHLKEKVEYLTVLERQKRGAWHIHVLLFCSFVPLPWLLLNWNKEQGQGSFKIEKIDMVQNLGRYLAKYVSKTFIEDGAGLTGSHRFWHSTGLKDRSVKLYVRRVTTGYQTKDILELFSGCLSKKPDGSPRMRSGEYQGEYTGRVMWCEFVVEPGREAAFWIGELVATLHAFTSA